MSELLPYRSQRQLQDDTAMLGWLVFLASWTMLFAAALFAYGVLRLGAPGAWPSPGLGRVPPGVPALATLALIAAAAAMQAGWSRIGRGRPLELSAALILALLFGLLFLGLEVVVWRQLALAVIHLRDSLYGPLVYAVTGLLALHAAIGVAATATLLVRSVDGEYSAARHLAVKLWTFYWHFVAAMGIVVFGVLFWA